MHVWLANIRTNLIIIFDVKLKTTKKKTLYLKENWY